MKINGITFLKSQWVINIFFMIIIYSICACSPIKSNQKNSITQYDSITRINVYVFVEKMPKYKGGENTFTSDFGKIFHYDPDEEESLQTELRVQFIISKKGHLIGARIHNKKVDELTKFEKSGLKALKKMQNWEVGIHNNKPVDVILTRVVHIDVKK